MKRDGFGSHFGALLAIIGSAVGLGNLWKFPYMAGSNGGAAFIVIYILLMFLLCLPLMLSEFIIGRRAQLNPVGAFKKLAPGSKWYLTGDLGVLTAFLILSFYSVVGGWAVKYLFNFSTQFTTFVESPIEPIGFHLLFLAAAVAIVWTGVKNGIEKYSKILMPVLFLMILGLAIYAVSLPGAEAGIEFLIKPDWSKVTPEVALNALGQGLFSMSLGMGTVITYSSYINKQENLCRTAIISIIMDLLFALLAGFAILPAVFSFGFSPEEGPGLLFIILPEVFSHMPMGGVIALVFFIVLVIAALTSAISLLEVVVAYLTEQKNFSRKKALILSGCVLAITGSLCSLSLGVMSDFKLFGLTIFDLFDKVSSTYMMPIGAFFITIFVGWKLRKKNVLDELSNGGTIPVRGFSVIWFLIRYFVPVAIVLIFLNLLGLFH